MGERNLEVKTLYENALADEAELDKLTEQLSIGARRTRQVAAAAISLVAKDDITRLVPYGARLVDALNRPEAQTRWECLDALTLLVDHDSRTCDKAILGAETALFDEESGPVRLAAMRFLCKLGSTTPTRSEKVWPLIDEGIQCYHGDLEFNDMLVAICDFSQGKLDAGVKKALKERMEFDAVNGKGTLKKRAQQIVANVTD